MTHIGIVGAGVAGLHLGLYLRQHGIETTLYAEKRGEQQFSSRIPALVARAAHTRERERLLGVNYWDGGNSEFNWVSINVTGEHPLSITGQLNNPFIAVDMRLYFGRLQEEFAARGGRIVVGEVKASDLERLSDEHDLLVIASGRGGVIEPFARVEEDSPHAQPQRWIATGIFRGIQRKPLTASVTFVPTHAEIFEFPIYSLEPNVVGLGIESLPGGVFDELVRMRYEDDPKGFETKLLDLLCEHTPELYSRIDPEKFGLTRPLDLMQGGVTPTVRRGYARLANGKLALAIGDAHIVNDPLTGQGANTASRVAWMLGEAIRSNPTFDEAFCQQFEQQVRAYAIPVAKWTNAMLAPPQDHANDLMVAASQSQEIADEFVSFFEKPVQAWNVLSSAEATAAFLAEHGWHGQEKMVAA